MILPITFSIEAKETLLTTTSFIKHKWGKASSEKFKTRVDKVLKNISQQPYLFKASDFDENVRQGFITKQCSVYYQIQEDSIYILFFWDNRQDPIFTPS